MEKIKIDLHDILRSRIGGWKGRLIPGFLISALERLVRQRELNEILDITYPSEGTEFSRRVYEHLGLGITVEGLGNIPGEGRFIFASNHPLGGLDGIGIIKVLGARYGDDGIRFLVNDMLMNVAPLRNVFLPVNKYGSQGRAAAAAIADAFASPRQIIIFPAGLVSRLRPDGSVKDLEWQKSFIQKAIEYRRDIIPMRFEGLNRPRFYRIARWRKRLGIKVNIEQVLLPAELCASRGRSFRIAFGTPISWQSIAARVKAGESLPAIAASIRSLLYSIS